MEFKIKKENILDVLSKVQGLAGRKSNLAITSNVLIQATDDGITLSVTDLETGYEGLFAATIESKGSIAINARKLYEIVREFPSDEIQVHEIENHWVKISNDIVEYNIVGMNPDDFPDSPQIEAVEFFEIDSAELKKMIDKMVIISGAGDEKRAHITGIYFEVILEDDQRFLRMVSTDGNRLSKVDCPYTNDTKLSSESGVLIPKKGLQEAIKFLDYEGPAQIGFKNSNFIIKKDSETIIIRLLEGEFPEYSDIIKKSVGHDIRLENRLFAMMLKRMSILSSEDYKGVIFNFASDNLMITTTNPNIGESKEEMQIEYQGQPIKVMFNPRYFIETLNVIENDIINLHIVDEEKPCLIQEENDDAYLSVIMPMRI